MPPNVHTPFALNMKNFLKVVPETNANMQFFSFLPFIPAVMICVYYFVFILNGFWKPSWKVYIKFKLKSRNKLKREKKTKRKMNTTQVKTRLRCTVYAAPHNSKTLKPQIHFLGFKFILNDTKYHFNVLFVHLLVFGLSFLLREDRYQQNCVALSVLCIQPEPPYLSYIKLWIHRRNACSASHVAIRIHTFPFNALVDVDVIAFVAVVIALIAAVEIL